MSDKLPLILAAEDEESDQMLLKLAFKRIGLPDSLVIVSDGQEAVDYLNGEGAYADRSAHPLPTFLILDLKMPRMSGLDVLVWLATQTAFKELPAVILSSSSAESDMQKARKLGAREYFVKPHDFDTLIDVAHQMQKRWLTTTAESLCRDR